MEAFHCLNELGKNSGGALPIGGSPAGRGGRAMAGDRCVVSAVVGKSFLVVASSTLVVWMGISAVGLLSSSSRKTARAGVGFQQKNVFTLACSEVNLFVPTRENSMKGPDTAVILRKFLVTERQGSWQRVKAVFEVINC